MRKTIFFLFLLFSFRVHAQEIYSFDHSLTVNQSGTTLSSPFSGGINSAQIQTIDLDGDEIEEWVIWDINSRQLQVYKKSGNNFTHLPELSYFFPSDIAGFLILADFDFDGKKDLFTSTPLGIKAYKNSSIGSTISWEVAQNFLKIDNSGNIQANNLDTPLIQDLDGDGDLDLVIFNFASGDYLEFYENTSMDRKGNPDIDGFAFPETHWGNFEFCGCGDIAFGATCSGIDLRILSEENDRIQHAGGHSILYRDFDGDGVSDLVLGRDECSTLYFLPNQGDEENALFSNFTNELPTYGRLPEFPIFHAAQEINEELIISLNTNESAINYGIDFQQSLIKLDRNGQEMGGFLQDQMIDMGENSRPIYIGNKKAGSIFALSNQLINGQIISKQSIFELEEGSFQKLDVLNTQLDELELIDAQNILFNDLDGVHHNLVSGIRYINGIPSHSIYELNEDQSQYLRIEWEGYQPNRGDYLEFFHFEEQDYLLVAAQNGSLDLYQMDFSKNTAILVEEDFLGFEDNPANRNLIIAVDDKALPDLYAVDQNGLLIKIANFMNSTARTDIQIKISEENYPTRLGRNTWIALVRPIFEGNPDLILGTRAGGLIYLKAEGSSNPPTENEFQIRLFPNPSAGPIKILSNLPAKGRLVTALGQVLLENIEIKPNQELEIQSSFLTPGLYILQLEVDGKFTTSRKIWMK